MARKYNNAEDFIDDCNMGLDIEFSYHDIGYGKHCALQSCGKPYFNYFCETFFIEMYIPDINMYGSVCLNKQHEQYRSGNNI